MFGFFGKKKKEANGPVDEFIFAVYGNPPPKKRADLSAAIEIANSLLMGVVPGREVKKQAISLNEGPIPYSTHDLALSVAMSFFRNPALVPKLFEAQLMARMAMLGWLQDGLVAPPLVQSFENVLYKLYKPTE